MCAMHLLYTLQICKYDYEIIAREGISELLVGNAFLLYVVVIMLNVYTHAILTIFKNKMKYFIHKPTCNINISKVMDQRLAAHKILHPPKTLCLPLAASSD